MTGNLRQDRPTKGTFDTGSSVRRTRVKTYSLATNDQQTINTQRYTERNRETSKWTTATTMDKLRIVADVSGFAQRCVDNPSAPLPDDSHKSKQHQISEYVSK